MKKNIIFLFFTAICIFSISNAQEIKNMTEIQEKITSVKAEYAPDKRVSVFNIEFISASESVVLKGETNLPKAKDALLNKLNEQNINFTDNISLLPSEELGDKIYGVVNLSVSNIRTEPRNGAELSTQALLGTQLNILKKNRGYYLVQTPDEYIGWQDDDGFEFMNEQQLNEWKKSEKVIYTAYYGFSYSQPDDNSVPVSDLVKGNILKFLSQEDDFCKVEYPDKRTAYIPVNNCKKYDEWLSSINVSQEKIISTAMTFMGIPYLWGGTSMKGVDCSGFTKTVYYLNGIILPRDASQQVHVGELIDTQKGFDNLQPGDLVFFGRKATADREERATHVGIYIGNSEFIHSSGRVRINSFDKEKENFNEYRFNTFLKARRILTSLDKNGVYLLKNHPAFSGL